MNGDFTFNITGNLHDESDRRFLSDIIDVCQKRRTPEWPVCCGERMLSGASGSMKIWRCAKCGCGHKEDGVRIDGG